MRKTFMNYKEFAKSLKIDKNGKSPSFYTDFSFKTHSLKLSIRFLKNYSKKFKSDVRICFHPNLDHELHAMIILQNKFNNYLPHKHPHVGDTIMVCSGRLLAKIFDDKGKISEENNINENEIYLMPNNVFHCFYPLTDQVIYLEFKPGPFKKFGKSIFPEWVANI